jgi:3-isopropylmalate/(R)-2-methylmalate dehydratase small subunit
MNPFTTITGIAAPIAIKDVDTDMIIPAQFMTSISRDGYGQHVFSRLRSTYPDFYLNVPTYQEAQILIADSNFGCGSSREHAVWALYDSGIRVIIGTTFADIFSNNCGKNGLLLVSLPQETIAHLLRASAETAMTITVNLETQTVSTHDDRIWNFECDPFLKHCLTHGLDDLDYLRSRLPDIEAKKQTQQESTFFDARYPHR